MTVAAPPRRRFRQELRAPIPWRRTIVARAWWISPHVLSLVLWVPLVVAVGALSPSTFRTYWDTPKFIDDSYVQLFVWSSVAFALTSFTLTQVMRSSSKRKLRGSWLLEPGFRRVVFRLFVLGAVATLGFAVLRAGGPVGFLRQASTVVTGGGGSAELRRAFAPVSGLTSLTQLGVLIVMLEAINLTWRDDATDRRASRRRLVVVVAFGLTRALLASERLAVAELLVPTFVVWARAKPLRSARQALLMVAAPLLAAVVLLFGFYATEYLRSYQAFKERVDESPMEYSRNRLLGYYAAALNNSALYMQHDTPKAPFTLLLDGVLSWPGVRESLQISDPNQVDEKGLLETYANPNFTNRAPVGVLHLEGNSLFVVSFVAAFGAVAGIAYAGYRYGSVGASVWFGLCLTAMIEFPRIWYLTSSRMSAVFLAGLVGWFRYQRVRT